MLKLVFNKFKKYSAVKNLSFTYSEVNTGAVASITCNEGNIRFDDSFLDIYYGSGMDKESVVATILSHELGHCLIPIKFYHTMPKFKTELLADEYGFRMYHAEGYDSEVMKTLLGSLGQGGGYPSGAQRVKNIERLEKQLNK